MPTQMISLCSVIFLLLLKYCWADLFSRGPWQLLLLIPTWTDEHIAEHNCPFELSASVSHKTGDLSVATQHVWKDRG